MIGLAIVALLVIVAALAPWITPYDPITQALRERLQPPLTPGHILGTDDFGLAYKPAEKAYLTVCRQLAAAPHDCIMIDDSANNLHAAKALGMRTVWYGQRVHELPFVDFAAPDMAALAEWGAGQK